MIRVFAGVGGSGVFGISCNGVEEAGLPILIHRTNLETLLVTVACEAS